MRKLSPIVVAIGALTAASAQAGVKSLSSDEMVDTYIKDSAIIVVPKKKSEQEIEREKRKKARQDNGVVQNLVISPGEPVVTPSEKQHLLDKATESQDSQYANAVDTAQKQALENTIVQPFQAAIQAQQEPETGQQVPVVAFGQQATVQIPKAPFNQTYFNQQLGLSYDGQKVDFSIGNNLPGVKPITIPYGIHQGGINLTPKAGGGFNLSIDVPKN